MNHQPFGALRPGATLCASIWLGALLVCAPAAQEVAFNTGGAALAAMSAYAQTSGGLCPASSTVNGRLDGGALGGGVVDFWAALPWNQSTAVDILWTFQGGARVVDAAQIMSYYAFGVSAFGPHRIGDFWLDYTNSPTPSLGGTFQPVQVLAFAGATGSIQGNRVVVAAPGGDDYRIEFVPVVATGIRLTVAPGSGISFNHNWVLSEVSFRTTTQGLLEFGAASPACQNLPILGASHPPQVGQSAFTLLGFNGPSNGVGVFALGTGALGAPVAVLGANVWLASPLVAVVATTGISGYATLSLPLPASAGWPGTQLDLQAFWLDPCAAGGLSASQGLELVLF